MESALRVYPAGVAQLGENIVSILVVVESALRDITKLKQAIEDTGFNPCCSGIGPAGLCVCRDRH